MKPEHTPLTDAELEKFAAYQMSTDDWLWLRIVADLREARRLLRHVVKLHVDPFDPSEDSDADEAVVYLSACAGKDAETR